MIRRLITLSTLFVVCNAGSVASAESGTVLSAEYMPLMERQNGKFVTCGIHYSAVVQGTDTTLGVQGSWNYMFYPDYDPSIAMKALAVTPQGNSVAYLDLSEANYKGKEFETFGMNQQAGDANSRLIVFSLPNSPVMYERFQNEMPLGFWVFLSLQPGKNDFSFKLPKFDAANGGDDALIEMLNCTATAFEAWIEDNLPTE